MERLLFEQAMLRKELPAAGDQTDDGRDHEGKLMADEQHTCPEGACNDVTAEDAEDAEWRSLDDEDRARRRASAALLGRRVVGAVASRIHVAGELRPIASDSLTRALPPAAERTTQWKGPTAGKKYASAASLEKATIEECAAGFQATWGRSLTDADREAFRATILEIPEDSFAREEEARKIYSALKTAIDDATAFAEREHDSTAGSAAVALNVLWGRLPALPLRTGLPSYAAAPVVRRSLAERWQATALRRLGRRLRPRELAELSVLIGVGPGKPYRDFFRARIAIAVSPADVLREEAKRLEKFDAGTATP